MKMHFSMIFLFFMGLFSFVMNRKHMLMMLLGLEFIILSLLFLMFMYFLNLKNEYIFMLLWVFFYTSFIFYSLRESLSLSLSVSPIRFHGSDYFNLLILLW